MGIPVAQIQQIPKMTLEDLRNLFEESNRRLDEKIHMLQAAQDRAGPTQPISGRSSL